MGSGEKAFPVTCMGDCGLVAGFIRKSAPAPWVSNVPALSVSVWEKVQPCLQQDQNKSQFPEFVLHLTPWGSAQSSAGPGWPLDLNRHVFLGECRPEGRRGQELERRGQGLTRSFF